MTKAWRLLGAIFYWISWPALVVLVPHTKRARIIVRSGQDILLVRPWHGPGDYGLPGGGKKRHETIYQAAVRELFEETGIALNDQELVSIGRFNTNFRLIISKLEIYELDLEARPEVKPRPFEITSFQWINFDRATGDSSLSGEARQILSYCGKI